MNYVEKQQKMNKVSQIKRSFSEQSKFIEKDNLEKLKGDKLADKKMDFYNSVYILDAYLFYNIIYLNVKLFAEDTKDE